MAEASQGYNQPASDAPQTGHVFSCAKGGIIVVIHNELCGMSDWTFFPSDVCNKPKDYICILNKNSTENVTHIIDSKDHREVLICGM
jgi:hypothetical protein